MTVIHVNKERHIPNPFILPVWWPVTTCNKSPTMSNRPNPELTYLKLALERAKECIPVPTAFCVGCVIVAFINKAEGGDLAPIVLSTGYSRELEGNTHAEANALAKARALTRQDLSSVLGSPDASLEDLPTIDELLSGSDVYTTMEPCSVRLSGLSPCADALIAARVKRCIIGVGEPADFVSCEGASKLEAAGIEVVWMKDIEAECLAVARTGASASTS